MKLNERYYTASNSVYIYYVQCTAIEYNYYTRTYTKGNV